MTERSEMTPRLQLRPRTDLSLVRRLETAARRSWPAATEREAPGGWLLRATPGLDRGRRNHALTPCRLLAARELARAIATVESFAPSRGLRPGIQASPVALHDALEAELDAGLGGAGADARARRSVTGRDGATRSGAGDR